MVPASAPTAATSRSCILCFPCYNEAEGLVHTADVLAAKVAHLTETGRISKQSRILFVDDGSKDDTWSIIRNLHERDAHLFGGVKLSHNRGHQNALLAGLMTARAYGCDAAISMDADLQDDVNAVDEFIDGFCNGNEIVYGVRSARKKDTWFKRTTAEAFYKVFERMGAADGTRPRRLPSHEPRDARRAQRIPRSQPVPAWHRAHTRLPDQQSLLRARRTRSGRIQIPVEEDDRLRDSGHHLVLHEAAELRHRRRTAVYPGSDWHVRVRARLARVRPRHRRLGGP